MKNPKLDPNDAPKGYMACALPEETNGCGACAFQGGSTKCLKAKCVPDNRDDRRHVYFQKRPRRAVKSNLPTPIKAVLANLQKKAPYRMPKPSAMPVEIWLSDSDVRAIRRALGIRSYKRYLESKEKP